MGQYYVDEAGLREPNLLIPGKKPVGPVKIDWSNPLTNGLVHFWLLNDGREVARDMAGAGPDGAKHGTVGSDVVWTVTSQGICPEFKLGTYSYINTTGGDYLNLQDLPALTVEAVWYSDMSGTAEHTIFGNWTGSGAALMQRADPAASDSLETYVRTTSGAPSHIMTSAVNANTWYRSFLLFDVVDLKSYIGELTGPLQTSAGTATAAAMANSQAEREFYLGASPIGADDDLVGPMAYCRLWHRRLSESEIYDLHRDPYQILIPA